MVKRVVVGANYGFKDWLLQRLSAAVMALYLLVLMAVFLFFPPEGYEGWKNLVIQTRIPTLVFLFALYFHAWVGVRDILMDYVHQIGIRLFLQTATVIGLLAYAIWSVDILWGL